MDFKEAQEMYMIEYNKLTEKFDNKTIATLVEKINNAVSQANMSDVNLYFDKVSEWNEYVANVQGGRIALQTQFKNLKLPSVAQFMIVFDHINKEWRFNTQAD